METTLGPAEAAAASFGKSAAMALVVMVAP